jgi:O-antigen/teichoic acid export membrane protein
MQVKRDILILVGGRIIQALLALVSIRFLTGILDKQNVGLTYLIGSLTFYFSLVFINPIGMFLNRRIHLWFQERRLLRVFRFLNFYFLLVALFSVPLVLISYFVFHVGSEFFAWQIGLLVFLNIYIGTWFQTLCPSLNMLEHRGAFVGINLATQILGLLASMGAVIFIDKTAFFWLMGILVGQAVGALLSWYYFKIKVENIEATGLGPVSPLFLNRTVLQFCLPIALTTAFMWGQQQSYRLIVDARLGAEVLALIGVGLSVATSIASVMESLVNQYFYPGYYAVLAKEGIEARLKAWKNLFDNSMAVYIPVTMYVIFGAPFILKLLVSSQYSDVVYLVIIGSLVEFLRATTNIFYSVSQSEMKTRSTLVPYGLGAVVVVAGLFLILDFASPMKIIYLPMLLFLAGLTSCVSMYKSMRKVLPISINGPFVIRSFFMTLPMALMLTLVEYSESFLVSFVVCGVSGLYLLWVLRNLHQRIQPK